MSARSSDHRSRWLPRCAMRRAVRAPSARRSGARAARSTHTAPACRAAGRLTADATAARSSQRDGGRGRESNPPGTAKRPHPVLKTGRPTGGRSSPLYVGLRASVANIARASRCTWRQSVEDPQVRGRLRHRSFVGGDGQHVVDACGANHQVADQLLVSRRVDEREYITVGQRPVREAEIDRDVARRFFLQRVGVDADEGFDRRRLAVADVTCCSDDQSRRPPRVNVAQHRADSQRGALPTICLRSGPYCGRPEGGR